MSKEEADIQPEGSNFDLALEDQATVSFGDSDSSTFKPMLEASAFGDSASAKFGIATTENILPTLTDGVLDWLDSKNNILVRQYEHADKGRWERGAIEQEIILMARPDLPEVEFILELEDLDLLYQGPLSDLEVKRNTVRPIEMMGGYCAYHSTKSNFHTNVGDAENYRAGKAFDLPRPTATEVSTGKWIWGNWIYDPKFSRIRARFDSDWMAAASYPVLIGPTIGYTTAGSSSSLAAFNPASSINVDASTLYTASAGDTIVKFSSYAKNTISGTQDAAAYSFSGSSPNARLAAAVTIALTTTAQWNDSSPVSQALSAGTKYGSAAGNDTLADTTYYSDADSVFSVYVLENLPPTWTGGGTDGPRYSQYATYTPGGTSGGGPIVSGGQLINGSTIRGGRLVA